MQLAEDQGGSRGLLRQTINELRLKCDNTVVLGDFNSSFTAREITSWHCFYVLSGTHEPHPEAGLAKRRGLPHPALYAVRPDNSNGMGTFRRKDTGANEHQTVDFIAVDKGIHEAALSKILTMVSAQSVRDSLEKAPKFSDHLPVEGTVDI
jgi:endonuclease/exonuclease/phosphatase family metal-dependent hydrolase